MKSTTKLNTTQKLRQIYVDFQAIATAKRNNDFKENSYRSNRLNQICKDFENNLEAQYQRAEEKAINIFKELGYNEDQCVKALELLKYNFLYYTEYHFEITVGLDKYKYGSKCYEKV